MFYLLPTPTAIAIDPAPAIAPTMDSRMVHHDRTPKPKQYTLSPEVLKSLGSGH